MWEENLLEKKPCWKPCLWLDRVWVCLNKANSWLEFSIRFNWWGTRFFLEGLIMHSWSKCLAYPSRWIAWLSVSIILSFCHSCGNFTFFSLSFLKFFGLIILSCIWLCKNEFCSKDEFFHVFDYVKMNSVLKMNFFVY